MPQAKIIIVDRDTETAVMRVVIADTTPEIAAGRLDLLNGFLAEIATNFVPSAQYDSTNQEASISLVGCSMKTQQKAVQYFLRNGYTVPFVAETTPAALVNEELVMPPAREIHHEARPVRRRLNL